MQKLADIGMFEGLQAYANQQLGFNADGSILTSMNVFNASEVDNGRFEDAPHLTPQYWEQELPKIGAMITDTATLAALLRQNPVIRSSLLHQT